MNGLPPIGCLPIQMTAKSPLHRTCIEKENSDSQSYNKKLEELLPHLQAQLRGSKIFYSDIYTPLSHLINNPHEYGKLSVSCSSSLKILLNIYIDFFKKFDINIILFLKVKVTSVHFS